MQVAHVETLKDETVIVLANGTEEATSVMDLLKITKAKVEGMTRDLPAIGCWHSPESDTFYLAIDTIIERNGETIPPGAK